ncbi:MULTISPECIES: spore coat protein [Bacillaceae]|uniref:spore coat protein n=1 Tax=Bacillaceae TaxID=186817 RepID=UPI00047E0A9A|nr:MULTISPECIES: spore coat protein [Bacillaceae]UOE93013.1 spore coat protein [Alkalihalobacillus sp. LMS39]
MNQEVYRSSDRKEKKWSALDPKTSHPLCPSPKEEDVAQEATQANKTLQLSEEYILIKDSCDVTVTTTDTKAAVSLQASLQAAIAIVISISIADSATAERITQELLQTAKVKQMTYQKTIIENSRNVDVTTTDTQAAINIQLLLQLLLALLVKLDIL